AASMTFTIAGVTFTAAQPAVASSDRWLSGPLAYEGRSVVAPVSAVTGLPHPFLRVNFDTRVYNDGKGRVDVSVENVLDQLGAGTVTYDAAITINGAPVFTKAAVQHFYLTRWRKVFSVAGTTLSAVTPDIVPFNTSRALPPYLPLVANFVNTVPATNYDILQSGALGQDMSLHGGLGEDRRAVDRDRRVVGDRCRADLIEHVLNGDVDAALAVAIDAGVEVHAQERMRQSGHGRYRRDHRSAFVGERSREPAIGRGHRRLRGGEGDAGDRERHRRRWNRRRERARRDRIGLDRKIPIGRDEHADDREPDRAIGPPVLDVGLRAERADPESRRRRALRQRLAERRPSGRQMYSRQCLRARRADEHRVAEEQREKGHGLR
ncbi:MAG TPA: hypothetical protein VNG89_15800, partial [Vicinamibacterales bacterium]|nr:hypothetical protein [Vicinamibacterales bacterium]